MSELNATNLRKEQGNEGPDLVGVTELTSPYFMVPPSGTTEERPQNPEKGTLRFNTDIGSLEYFRGNTLGWESINRTTPNLGGGTGSNTGLGARGCFTGGYNAGTAYLNTIDYITVSTLGDAQDFGDTLDPIKGQGTGASRTRLVMWGGQNPSAYQDNVTYVTFASTGNATDTGDLVTACRSSGLSNQIRGIIAGTVPYTNTMEYSNIATLGDTKDYGDLTSVRGYVYTLASTTRGIIAGGLNNPTAPAINIIDYTTIMSTGNALDFGDLNRGTSAYEGIGFSNATRGIFAAGYDPTNYSSIIDYITIATLGNSVDFGDLTNISGTGKFGCSSSTRGIIGGGYKASPSPGYTTIIEYIEIMTTGNAKDFGDLTVDRRSLTDNGSSNAHGGL